MAAFGLGAGLGPSWLSSMPDGAVVTARAVHACTVTGVFDDHFSARTKGRRARDYHSLNLVAGDDLPLVRPCARFWLVAEQVRLRGGRGRVEGRSAIRFRRPGIGSDGEALAADKAKAGGAA